MTEGESRIPKEAREWRPSSTQIEVVEGLEGFIPQEFKDEPFTYFEREGVNVKETVKDDKDKVKDLPDWNNGEGSGLQVLGKKVRVDKAEVGKSGDPYYEYRVMEMIQAINLPCPRPIAKATRGEEHLIIMERVAGYRTTSVDKARLKEEGLTEEDFGRLVGEVTEKIEELKQRFEEAGFIRAWKPKDMVFDIDLESKSLKSVTPVDWERTQIDQLRYEAALAAKATADSE